MGETNNHDTAKELEDFRREQSEEHKQIQEDTQKIKDALHLQKACLAKITKQINDIYPVVKNDIKRAEAYKIVGEDLKMKGSGWKFWMSIIAVGLSIVLAVRSFMR